MKYDLLDKIPTLDLNKFVKGNNKEKSKFVNDLGASYENIGFVAIKNHGFSEKLQSDLYQSIKSFYNLPEEIKNNYDGTHTGGQRGYTGKGKEHAAGRNIGDLKEFYHIGKEIKDPYLEILDKHVKMHNPQVCEDFSKEVVHGVCGVVKSICHGAERIVKDVDIFDIKELEKSWGDKVRFIEDVGVAVYDAVTYGHKGPLFEIITLILLAYDELFPKQAGQEVGRQINK